MSTSFQAQVASIMEVLANTAAAEITKLVDDVSAALRLEMCRSQRENEALKKKLLLMEGELRAVRGYGEGTPGSSLNLSFEVEVCDEFREAQIAKVAGKGSVSAAERVLDERLSAHLTRDDQNLPVEKRRATADVFDIKWEPVDGEQDWSESLLLSEDRLEEDPKSSQSQAEQMISEENTCGTSGAAAANGGEGPLCKEEELHMQPCPAGDPEKELQAELKQEPEEQPLTPTLPLSVDLGLELQSVWSKANSLEISQEKNRQCGRSLEQVDAHLNDAHFSLPHYRAWRPRSEKGEGSASQLKQKQNGCPLYKECSHGLPDEVSAEMPFLLGSPGECDGSAPCEASSDTSAEAKSPCRTEGQEEFICTRCGKTFPDTLELKTHEQQHSAGKRFSCSECSKGFTSSSVLEKHELVHSREKPFTCSVCDKSFSQSHVLQAHKRTHTGQKPYACVECGKCFSCKDLLKSHQCVHTREKPFTCEQCGRRFARKSSLKIHQVTHTGEKCFSCPVCNKSFGYLHVLKQHQSVHTGEKPHYCKQCGKCFSQTSTLKTHQRVHTREKPFSCKWCGKCFSQISTLNTHQVTHTGERPHRCNECGKSFAHRGNLKSHQRVHTGWNNVQLHTVQQEVLPESLQNNSVPTSRGVLCNVFGTN